MTMGHAGHRNSTMSSRTRFCLALSIALLILAGCGGRGAKPADVRAGYGKAGLQKMGYTIQAGAFSRVENAARLTDSLKREGLSAYYFVYSKDLYKVRFGNYPTEKAARQEAARLRAAGIIEEYFIVTPGQYAAARKEARGEAYLRDEIVRTAESFIGVPYLYGGDSPDEGFDCSGLTMAVYQMNGLNLPRSSREQFQAGDPVDRRELERGDLVFFSTTRDGKVSHVGLYIGDGRFVHAPGRGKKISVDSFSSGYFAKRYAGGRTYI